MLDFCKNVTYNWLRKRNERQVKYVDWIKLKYFMAVAGYSNIALAKEIGINEATLSKKMHGHSQFSRSEMLKIKDLLHLSDSEFMALFFAK